MRVLIVRNNSNPQAIDASLLLIAYFASQGMDYVLVDGIDLAPTGPGLSVVEEAVAEGLDMAVVLGGDGTILRTARSIGNAGVPILGLNFGRLGFLANACDEGVVSMVAEALAGDITIERRTNLRVDVVCEGEIDPWVEGESAADDFADGFGVLSGIPDHRRPHTYFALNEAAITRGDLGRIIDFSLGISGSHIAEMRGDGLVVATATGSTGYALSTGGPVVAPGFNGLVVVPIAPHTLHSRSIITSENDVVEMDLSCNAHDRAATLFVDGDMVKFATPIRRVYVRRGEEPTRLFRCNSEGFYSRVSEVFF